MKNGNHSNPLGNHFAYCLGGDVGSFSFLPLSMKSRRQPTLPSKIRRGVEIGPLTTFGVGGRARYYWSVGDKDELVAAVVWAREQGWRYFILTGGSNVVGPDRWFNGLVIHYRSLVSRPRLVGRSIIVCEAGVPLEVLVRVANRYRLAGLAFLAGIPGTIGGAIVGNAGAYGQCVSDCLTAVRIWDGRKLRRLKKAQCRFAYRESVFKEKDWLVLAAEFRLRREKEKNLAAISRRIVKLRDSKYRPGLRCPGSFFKNVLVKDVSKKLLAKIDPVKIISGKIPAGYLLERAGACGMKTKHLEVASHHGNLIINRGAATTREVKALARRLKNRVFQKFGIWLEEEVRYLT